MTQSHYGFNTMQFKKSFVLYIETIVTTLEPECAMAYNVDVDLSSNIELEEEKNDLHRRCQVLETQA